MAGVLAAFRAYEESQDEAAEAARAIVDRAEALLGQEIHLERKSGTKQLAIAAKLRRTREQVRRYERTYREWLRDHPGETLG